MAATLVEHVVADAGAFLRGATLQEIGKNIYTIKDVVNEIRDKETKRRLAVLPYELHFKEPLPENVKLVTEFAKKTGDYPSLSATDLKVLALAYQLVAEHIGVDHLRQEPEQKITVTSTVQHPEAPVNLAGFHLPSKPKTESPSLSGKDQRFAGPENPEFGSFIFWRDPLPSIEEDLLELLSSPSAAVSVAIHREPQETTDDLGTVLDTTGTDSEEEDNEEEEEEEDDDGGGWITPSNIKQVQLDMRSGEPPINVKVGCLTTDFAMQNVLIQMGIHVLAVSGMLIRQTRNYILRCHGCFRTTSNMTKVFCPSCGNRTLKKVAVTVNKDGSTQMHLSRNPKVLNTRGLRYSLPIPKGGKHAHNPQLVDDQHFPQQRLSKKAKQKTDALDPDYIAGVSPFAENDIYSRAANLQIRDGALGAGRRRVNPNTTKKKFVKKR
ncbi:RNA-binding protein NOB1 [Lissotriton helveticus]